MGHQLFGTDGIRGTANEYPITPEVAMRCGRAIARVVAAGAKERKVMIGKDTRASGAMLEAALISGLVSEGVDVLLAGQIPTPAIALLTEVTGCSAGVMLTASHNPYQDNGIKIFGPDGYKLDDDLEARVEAMILSEGSTVPPETTALGTVMHVSDASERYLKFAQTAIAEGTSFAGKKIVVDAANGAGYVVAPVIFQALGAEVISLGVEPDGRNINAGVGSMAPDAAAEKVREVQADLGVCLDGDADRVIFIDEKGEVVGGDKVLCMCALALKKCGELKSDTLVATVMSNLGLRDALADAGIALETTGVGDRLVIQRMKEQGYNLGGENSGHIIFGDHGTTGDGIISALKVLEFMISTDQKLSQLADCMAEYPQLLVNLPVTEKPPIDDVPELVVAIRAAESAFGDRGRVLVRYSGTEKKIRLLVEAEDAKLAQHHSKALVAAVQSSIG